MRSYKKGRLTTTTIKVNEGYNGETIEKKVRRIVNNKEPITDGAPLVYTERKDGVKPEYNIRTDKWDIALDAMAKVQQAQIAKREERKKTLGEQAKENMEKENGGAEPIQATT